eukprot:4213709-Pleurochrysis_carterae.AAC.2
MLARAAAALQAGAAEFLSAAEELDASSALVLVRARIEMVSRWGIAAIRVAAAARGSAARRRTWPQRREARLHRLARVRPHTLGALSPCERCARVAAVRLALKSAAAHAVAARCALACTFAGARDATPARGRLCAPKCRCVNLARVVAQLLSPAAPARRAHGGDAAAGVGAQRLCDEEGRAPPGARACSRTLWPFEGGASGARRGPSPSRSDLPQIGSRSCTLPDARRLAWRSRRCPFGALIACWLIGIAPALPPLLDPAVGLGRAKRPQLAQQGERTRHSSDDDSCSA